MRARRWRPRLGAEAERDFAGILLGSRTRDEILPGLRALHVARHGRRGRHIILYRAGPEREIEIMRILHDGMELRRHLPTGESNTI